MKTIYIPKGETVYYDILNTENLVVEGCLHVAGELRTKEIGGKGSILAGGITADIIRSTNLESANIVCKRLIAERVYASEVVASESAVVSCYLTAAYVKTGILTVAASEISEIDAQQVINLPIKARNMFGTLLASALRSFWLSLFATPTRSAPVVEVVSSATPTTQCTTSEKLSEATTIVQVPTEEVDFELQRIIAQFKLARESGYTLRLIPGTPESNAPVFDLDSKQIIRPVA